MMPSSLQQHASEMANKPSEHKLSQFLIPGSNQAYYIPDFVSEDEETYLIRKIIESPQQKWKRLANRRLQLIGGTVSAKKTLIAEEMPAYVSTYPNIIGRIRDLGIFESSVHKEPNHIILNEYHAGQGIMTPSLMPGVEQPHEDGPSYHPVVATISLGSHTVFHYYRYRDAADVKASIAGKPNEPRSAEPHCAGSAGRSISPDPVSTIFLERRSIIITRSELYTTHLHGIDGVALDHIQLDRERRPMIIAADAQNLFSEMRGEGMIVANRNLIKQNDIQRLLREGGVLGRGTRYSLTCRDVEKVSKVNNMLSGRR